MIITRTPFRISFLGGGTDYPVWFKRYGGAILGTSIDKYCYIMVRKLPANFKEKYRIVYKEEEFVDDVEKIRHPAIRECIKFSGVKEGLEVIHWSDLPARKGMGTSSAFVVGLLKALGYYNFQMAIALEQDILKENVGNQDQLLCSIGGFIHAEFYEGRAVSYGHRTCGNLEKYLMLFDTGTSRIASEIARDLIKNIPRCTEDLLGMMRLVTAGLCCLEENRMVDFGKLLHNAWMIKRELSASISSPEIDSIYDKAREAGAIGGKILGAGGGGYMLFFVEPKKQEQVKKALGLKHVPFKFENTGSQVIYDNSKSES